MRMLSMSNATDDELEALIVAARQVVVEWDSNRLAAAVRELALVLRMDQGFDPKADDPSTPTTG